MSLRIQDFSIAALRINPLCKQELRKVLKQEYYFFNKRCCIDDGKLVLNSDFNNDFSLYGKHININAIVGMNGSGKSSLLEIMYRIINNFSSLLVRDTKRGAAFPLYYIDGLWADLYYVINDGANTHLECISCQGDKVNLFSDGVSIFPLELNRGKKKWSQADIAERWYYLFYTIVTNYSVQSFHSNDYKNELAYKLESGVATQKEDAQWMSSLFHKNDGYFTPIVLNPYRDENGNMNMEVEKHLTESRLTSILIFFKEHHISFIDGYKLHDIHYNFNPQIVIDKYIGKDTKNEEVINDRRNRIWNFSSVARSNYTYANVILRECGLSNIDYNNTVIERAAAYLVYKVLSIAQKYPSYADYSITGGYDSYDKPITEDDKENLVALMDEIRKDKSHITLKIRQTIRLLKLYNNERKQPFDLLNEFTFAEYQEVLGEQMNARGISTIMEQIPPSFFVPTISLDKLKGNKVSDSNVSIDKMSSGERQYLYNFSTIIYHMRNLLSIQDSRRIRYRAIHLVFDEVEICFHPEYQRKFISSLLSVLNRTRITAHSSVQITIATHSPFILSDVPQDNILYLSDGNNVSDDIMINPFGANINDILHQSFFLDKGFVGEFAQRKINSLVEYIKDGKNQKEWNKESAIYFIERIVGDPMISQLLMELLNDIKKNNAQDFN